MLLQWSVKPFSLQTLPKPPFSIGELRGAHRRKGQRLNVWFSLISCRNIHMCKAFWKFANLVTRKNLCKHLVISLSVQSGFSVCLFFQWCWHLTAAPLVSASSWDWFQQTCNSIKGVPCRNREAFSNVQCFQVGCLCNFGISSVQVSCHFRSAKQSFPRHPH